MYQDHVALLNSGIRHDPDMFCRAVTFAVLSIRQQFPTAVQSMKEFNQSGIVNPRYLWGHKRGAYDYLRVHKIRLWNSAKDASNSEDALDKLTEVPGLGIVKSAFVLQMMGHDIGCLDTRNIQRLGLNPREWRSDGRRKELDAFKRKIHRYVEFTQGRAEELWNDWCEDVARSYHVSSEEISADHLVIIPPQLRPKFRSLATPVPVIQKEDIPYDGTERDKTSQPKPCGVSA